MSEYGKIIRFPVERTRKPEAFLEDEMSELSRWVNDQTKRQNMEEQILYLLRKCGNLPIRLIAEKTGQDVHKVVICVARMVREQILALEGGLYVIRDPEDTPAA